MNERFANFLQAIALALVIAGLLGSDITIIQRFTLILGGFCAFFFAEEFHT